MIGLRYLTMMVLMAFFDTQLILDLASAKVGFGMIFITIGQPTGLLTSVIWAGFPFIISADACCLSCAKLSRMCSYRYPIATQPPFQP